MRDLAHEYTNAPRIDTWCLPLLVLPAWRPGDGLRFHPLAYDALLACRGFRIDRSCRQVADHFFSKAAIHKRAGGLLRGLDRATWHDIYGMPDGEQRGLVKRGRPLLRDLGAWPWVLFPEGRPPRKWWTLPEPAAALDEWCMLGLHAPGVVQGGRLESPQAGA